MPMTNLGRPIEREAEDWNQCIKIVRIITLLLPCPAPASVANYTMSNSQDANQAYLLTFCSSISSFGDRPNEYQTVADYFRAHFVQAYRRNSAANRRLYIVGPF